MAIGMHLVSRSPLILHGYNFSNVFSPVKELAPHIAEDATFIITPSWSLQDGSRMVKLRERYRRHVDKFPRIKVWVLANEEREFDLLQEAGIPSVLCNQNCFLDENTYRIMPAERLYRAVCNSRMSGYKRIHLAAKVRDCALVTYRLHEDDVLLEKKIYGHMPLMHFPQYRDGTWGGLLDVEELCELYGQSACGLILSALEGACFAVAEYLLCGLPVVTTPSIGGRDALLDPDYCVRCEPDADSVAQAVDKALALGISRETIRSRVLSRMWKERRVYLELLNRIARDMGSEKDFSQSWDAIFINKMMVLYDDEWDAVKFLARGGVATRLSFSRLVRKYHSAFKIRLKKLRFYSILHSK